MWARRHCLHERISDLLYPPGFEFPATEEDLVGSWKAVEDALGPQRVRVLARGSWAGALRQRRSAPPWFFPALDRLSPWKDLDFPFSWAEAAEGRWSAFALALARAGEGGVLWAVMGQLEGAIRGKRWPKWWEEAADVHAREGAAFALDMLERELSRSFFFWPILPVPNPPAVWGRSLTLPVYLAGWALARNVENRSLVCTGNVLEDGSLGEAGHLERKARLAAIHGFKGLLCPRGSGGLSLGAEGIEILEADDLDHAGFLWELSAGGTTGGLQEDFRSLRDPNRLAANVHLLSPGVLRWSGFDGPYAAALREISRSSTLIEDFVRNLERRVEDPNTSQDSLDRLLVPVTREFLIDLREIHPLAALKLAQVRMATASHRGRIREAEEWSSTATELTQAALRHAEGLHCKADLLNREFVHHRHNHYDFRMDLPEEVRKTLDTLRALHALLKQEDPDCTLPSLGKLYGTLAQNCGFCGPEHLEELCRYAELAREAFGNGRDPLYLADWRRQFCYVFYGLLDAGDPAGAEEILSLYLGTEPRSLTDGRIRVLTPYEHAAMARFLAETGADVPEYRRWMSIHLGRRPSRHPWPLWLMNAGLCREDPAHRREAFTESALACLRQGPTAQAMGLMPLQLLWKEGLQPHDWVRDGTRQILQEIRHSFGGQTHFSRLLEYSDWEEALFEVELQKPRLFPFTYR
ncbi:MAG TPA: hypothetical protein PLM79_01055 [Syntrophobacteraceae bacterium]|nr:hypothetical protein [Syntrophobacteraceae bacterium]